MRLESFDLNLLVALEALLEERNVTRAAARLNVTQSAMSAALKRLRISLQDEILIPHGKKMIPTHQALILSLEVSQILVRLKTLIATGTGFDPATSARKFRVNASDYVTTVVLVPVIERLQTIAPGIGIDLSLPGPMSGQQLERGEIDLILTPERFLETDHPRELLFEERHVVVGDRNNPLFGHPLSQQDYMNSPHAAVQIASRDTFIEAIMRQQAPGRRIEVTAPSFIQLPWFIRGTQRLGMMHERLAKVMQPLFNLAIAESPFELPLMREMMQHHVSRTHDPGLAWLRRQIMQVAEASGTDL